MQRKLMLTGALATAALLCGCATTPADINAEVNTQWDYHYADQPHGHIGQVMQKGGKGNCADFAVTKCALVERAGVNPARLSLWKYTRPDGAGHAICVVDLKTPLDWEDRGPFTVLVPGKVAMYEGQVATPLHH